MDYIGDAAFWVALGKIIWVNILLSGDNAVVIALAARNLAPEHQKRAIVFGSGAAIVLRVLLTLFAVELLQLPWLCAPTQRDHLCPEDGTRLRVKKGPVPEGRPGSQAADLDRTLANFEDPSDRMHGPQVGDFSLQPFESVHRHSGLQHLSRFPRNVF